MANSVASARAEVDEDGYDDFGIKKKVIGRAPPARSVGGGVEVADDCSCRAESEGVQGGEGGSSSRAPEAVLQVIHSCFTTRSTLNSRGLTSRSRSGIIQAPGSVAAAVTVPSSSTSRQELPTYRNSKPTASEADKAPSSATTQRDGDSEKKRRSWSPERSRRDPSGASRRSRSRDRDRSRDPRSRRSTSRDRIRSRQRSRSRSRGRDHRDNRRR